MTRPVIRARAPLRVSFGGGGTDVSPYCDERGGVVLGTTINRYATATLVPSGRRLAVRSLDYDLSISYDLDEPIVYDGQLDLAKAVLAHFRESYGYADGFEVTLHNDAPPGSGLGSSSAITVALITAIAAHLRLPFDNYELAELAYRIERVDAGIRGGRQDQYAATFGGFNFIEFHGDTTVVNPLRLRRETLFELEVSMVFAYVGGQHFSSHIIDKQVGNYRQGRAVEAMDRIKALAHDMKRALLLGRLGELGELLDASWTYKKQLAEGISTAHIDALYSAARRAGALGGKVTGAGGGGFMFFVCDPQKYYSVQESLRASGAQVVNFSFVEQGVSTWSVPAPLRVA